MLVVLEAAGLLVERVAPEWYLSPSVRPPYHRHGVPSRFDGPKRSPVLVRLGAGIVRVVSAGWAAFRRAQDRRAVIRELSAKDDRLLADIGIHRGQIPEVADGLVAGRPQHPTRLVRTPDQVRYEDTAAEGAINDNRREKAA